MAATELTKDNSVLHPSLEVIKEVRTRRSSIEGKYSQDDFRNLPEEEQISLLNKYLIDTESKNFEDGTFQFSRSTLAKLSEELGYEKSFVRINHSQPISTSKKHSDNIIYIERGRREQSVEKKITLSLSTNEKIVKLLGDKLSNIEKSKAIDAILEMALDALLLKKQDGSFGIAYRQTESKRLI